MEKLVRMESWVYPSQKAKAERLARKMGKDTTRSEFIRKLIDKAK